MGDAQQEELAIRGVQEEEQQQQQQQKSEYTQQLAHFRTALEALDGISASVRTLFCHLSCRQLGDGLLGLEVDDATCMRFLQARGMHVEKAARMYVQYRTWRASFVPLGHIPEAQVVSELHDDKIALQGRTKKGCPLVVCLGRNHHGNKDVEAHKRYFVHTFDKALASAPPGIQKITMIMDLKDFGYKNVDIKCSIAGFQTWQNYYPDSLDRLYMVHAPKLFRGVWKIISACLEKSMRDKILFLEDRNMTEVLLSEIDAAVLPSMYGGKAELVLIQDAHVPDWPK